MSDNKKYYFLKLKENFYDSEEMIILQNMPDGYLYSDILMKLYLRSIKNNGKLMFNDLIPYTPSILAQVVRHQIGTVERALKVFDQLKLIKILDNGAIYMLNIQKFIGSSNTEADRKRSYRDKIQNEGQLTGQIVGQMMGHFEDKRPPEIEIDIESELDLELNNKNGQTEFDRPPDETEVKPLWEKQFEEFYNKYPKKVKKQNTKKWFEKNKPSSELFSTIMNSLGQFRGCSDWLKEKGQYIPYPSTWLNQKRWEDEDIQKTAKEVKVEYRVLTDEEVKESYKNFTKEEKNV